MTRLRALAGRFHGNDWLSPVLVKETRQGLRGRKFELGYITIQGLLMLSSFATAFSNFLPLPAVNHFWIVQIVVLFFIQPWRAFQSLQDEWREEKVSNLLLTPCCGWNLVAGKWAAIMGQNLIFIATVLPWLTLRYFIAPGVNLFSSGLLLCVFLGIAAFTTAATLMAASIPSRGVRWGLLILLAGLCGLWMGPIATDTIPMDSGSVRSNFWGMLLQMFICAAVLVLVLFEIAAPQFSPESRRVSWRRRVLVLAGAPLILATPSAFPNDKIEMISAWFVGLTLAIVALERVNVVPMAYLPFARWRRLAWPFGFIFMPGWPTLPLFALVAIIVEVMALIYLGSEVAVAVAFLVGMVNTFVPFALIRLAAPRLAPLPTIVAWVCLRLIFVASLSAEDALVQFLKPGTDLDPALKWLHEILHDLIGSRLLYKWSSGEIDLIHALMLVAALLVLAIRAWPLYGEMLRLQNLAREIPRRQETVKPGLAPLAAAEAPVI